jgi:DNA polymerase I-like protein with 3'-5' exonuclease and polymerase domains
MHFAQGNGANEIRAYFNANPDTDYHDFVLDMVALIVGWDISTKANRKHFRKPIKNINFGLIYGMGIPLLCSQLGILLKEGRDLFKHYHEAIPYARETMDYCTNMAQVMGFITTILGRKSRFDLWEPAGRNTAVPLPLDKAQLAYGNIKRAKTHKALNRRLQGSSADILKVAMINCHKMGLFAYTGYPALTVHDELDWSDPMTHESGQAFAEVKKQMETAIPLLVPVKVESKTGRNWGECL